jgi:hypothetical protein
MKISFWDVYDLTDDVNSRFTARNTANEPSEISGAFILSPSRICSNA